MSHDTTLLQDPRSAAKVQGHQNLNELFKILA
jgi:hypothetical protein